MSKKKINTVLLIAVLAVWGAVGYRSIKGFFMINDVNSLVNSKFNNKVTFKNIQKDTFDLISLTHDPFLDKTIYNHGSTIVVANEKLVKSDVIIKKGKTPLPVVVTQVKYFPNVEYYGYIKSHQKVNELILVKIDTKLYKVRKNDNIDGLVISRIFKDSIEVGFIGEKKFIYIK